MTHPDYFPEYDVQLDIQADRDAAAKEMRRLRTIRPKCHNPEQVATINQLAKDVAADAPPRIHPLVLVLMAAEIYYAQETAAPSEPITMDNGYACCGEEDARAEAAFQEWQLANAYVKAAQKLLAL